MPQISLKNIVVDPATQLRAEPIESEYVKILADAYQDPQNSIPAVKLFSDDSGRHWIGDGNARVAARRLAGFDFVDAIVKAGGKAAAIHYALSANEEHGARRTNATRRKCVLAALAMPEHKDKTDRLIADLCRVSHTFVSLVRKSGEPNGQSTVERTRTGRDGRTYKAPPSDADENPASVVCDRCSRTGPVKDCKRCQKLREAAGAKAAKKRSQNGKVVYDWKTADAANAPVMREPDKLRKAYNAYPDWPEIETKYIKPMEKLLDELSNLRRDARKALLKLKD